MSTRDFTKVVVRELPPMLQEADCKAAFDKEFADRYNWFSFSKGKHGQVPQRARLKTTRNSTAYLNFRSAADVIAFKSRFDGQTFAGNRGAHQTCFVEYAPFQRIPKGRVKRDPREGTIEKDAAYKAFVEELEQQPAPLPTAEQLLDQKQEAGGGGESSGRVVTSLMQFFQEKYAPKVRAAARKPAVRGRGLVGSALASIAEGPGGAALRSSQSKAEARTEARAEARAASKEAMAQRAGSSGAADSGQAAREAARRALSSLRLSSEAQPAATSRGDRSNEGAAQPQDKVKAREPATKEPKMRPGFGAWQPRRTPQQEADDAVAAAAAKGATDAESQEDGSRQRPTAKQGTATRREAAAAAAKMARAAAAAAQAPPMVSAGAVGGPTASADAAAAPQHGSTAGQQRNRRGGPGVASARQALPSGGPAASAAEQPSADSAGGGTGRRTKGRGSARAPAPSTTSATLPSGDAPPGDRQAAPEQQGGGTAAKKPARHRSRQKKSSETQT